MSSRARLDLESRLDEVRTLGSQDPSREGDLSRRALTNAVNRACVVLLTAHLEGFLEDLVIEALDHLVSKQAVVDDLPLLLRAVHADEHLRQLQDLKDRKARAPRIERLFADQGPMWLPGAHLSQGMIRTKVVCAEMDNPGSTAIRQFLEYLGVDIQAHLQSTQGDTALFSQIDGLVGRRNSIAHGELGTNVTFSDVDTYLVTMQLLASEIDDAVARAVQAVCHSATLPW